MASDESFSPRPTSSQRSIELLSAIREHVAATIAPEIPKEKRYDVLMVLAALDIVLRELNSGDATLDKAVQAYAEALGEDEGAGQTEALEETLQALSARLSLEIREGQHDGAWQVHRQLRRHAVAVLEEGNPKYLRTRGA